MVNRTAGAVLVIEDNREMQELLRMILEHEGYCVAAAATGNEALEILRSDSNFSLILMDMTLPDMGWRSLLEKERVEGLGKEIPIIFCSASSEIMQMGLPAGVVGAIRKPFEIKDLLIKVETFKRSAVLSSSETRLGTNPAITLSKHRASLS